MTKTLTSAFALVACLSLAGVAQAQASGGPDAKGNAPLKKAHTVNDGAAKRGSNSFTEKQAVEHIEKSGFSSVTNLVKGRDGVWRGQATRGGAAVDVAMDFKGNVSTPAAGEPAGAGRETTTTRTVSRTSSAASVHHRSGRRRASCAHPSSDGAACSGVDRDGNGVSDKEDRALQAGARP